VERDVVTTARRVSGSIAGVVEELELRRPTLVTAEMLAEVLAAAASPLSVAGAAERLVRSGWLLPLRTRGTWEFVPAARAGRYGSDDDWIELRAVLARRPDAPVAVAFESAVWVYGFADHRPSHAVYVHRPGWRPPRSCDELRAVTFDWSLPTRILDKLPVLDPASVLVALAERPEVCRDWANADTWLGALVDAADPAAVLDEARARTPATLARLGHLADWVGHGELAERVRVLLPERLGVTYLGPRGPGARFSARWRLYDAALPHRAPAARPAVPPAGRVRAGRRS